MHDTTVSLCLADRVAQVGAQVQGLLVVDAGIVEPTARSTSRSAVNQASAPS